MKSFRKRLENLKSEVEAKFWELREQNSEIIFMNKDVVDSWEIEDYFDRRDDINGTVHEVCIPKIDVEGIHTIDIKDRSIRKVIRLRDLASIEDVISLVELMEIKCR